MTDHLNTVLSLRDDQIEFDAKQLAVLQTALKVKHATREDLALLFHQARRTGLDPFAKQIYMIARQEWDPDARAKVWRQTLQTGIDGFRLVARRSADRSGQSLSYDDPIWFDKNGKEHKVWLDENNPPAAARAVVHYGKGRFPFVAHYSEYVPLKAEFAPDSVDAQGKRVKGEKTGRMVPSGMWATRAAGQLYKCAEAGALRMACPQDLSGVYVVEEMERGESIDVEPVSVNDTAQAAEAPQRDWFADLDLTTTGEEVNRLWVECRTAGERTAEFDALCRARGAYFRDNPQGEEPPNSETETEGESTPEEPSTDEASDADEELNLDAAATEDAAQPEGGTT